MSELIKLFSYEFMQLAFLVGLITAVTTSYFSVFVVQRNMAFFGSGLAHSSLAGIAIALLIGIDPFFGASVYTMVCGVVIISLRRRSGLGIDTLVGVFFSFSMALGAILLSLSTQASSSAFRFLFGSLLGLNYWDAVYAGAILLICILFIPFWSRWGFSSFDSELARSEKAKVFREDLLLVLFVSLTISISVKILGMVLMAAFLVLPAASARLISRKLSHMTVWSIFFGILSCFSGLIISYFYDLPSGASIVLVMTVIFSLCYIRSQINRSFT